MPEASHEEQAPIRHLATASVLQRCSKLGRYSAEIFEWKEK
jgi:hypothetical protein